MLCIMCIHVYICSHSREVGTLCVFLFRQEYGQRGVLLKSNVCLFETVVGETVAESPYKRSPRPKVTSIAYAGSSWQRASAAATSAACAGRPSRSSAARIASSFHREF